MEKSIMGASKLSPSRARVIKALLEGGEHTHQQIADLCYDIWGIEISRGHITSINSGRRWDDTKRSFKMEYEITEDLNELVSDKVTPKVFTIDQLKLINLIVKQHLNYIK